MRRPSRSFPCAPALLAAAHLLAADPVGAQVSDPRRLVPGDTITIVAGERYAAGDLQARLLGDDYRDLWTAPIRVPVLDLDTFAGGLTPVKRGAGLQTISLRFIAPDGRQYNFRSVDKDQSGGLHPDFRETLVDQIAQDQVSSKHPGAALIAGPLLDAAGLMHPGPALYVMPDHPRLGEFRDTFAGMLGMLEVHPDEGEDEDERLFHGALRVAGTERLLEHLEASSKNRVDDRVYLRARLMDMLMGDWDRHVSQWRWARYDSDGVRWWVAVPEDRDNAFQSFDGLLPGLASARAPNMSEFGPEYADIFGLTENAQVLDRRLLSALNRAAFDSAAAALRSVLTDRVIDEAVASTPPEYTRLRGEELAAHLRARRNSLPEIATAFYDQLAIEVEVRGTDERDLAIVDRLDGGFTRVRLFGGLEESVGGRDAESGEPYFSRLFDPRETREVRIFLHGAGDRAVIRGAAPSDVLVRVIGGGGDDVLADSSTAPGGRPAIFYDHRGDNVFVRGPRTEVDTREFRAPGAGTTGFNENVPAHRDWGRAGGFEPWAAWRYNIGPVLGVGRTWTRYGFRRAPFAHRVVTRALWAPLETRFGLEAEADIRHTNSLSRTTVLARASQLGVTRFHGYGNDTPDTTAFAVYKIFDTELGIEPLYHLGLTRRAEVFAGPVVRYTWPDVPAGNPAGSGAIAGSDPFLRIGAQLGAAFDGRDLASYPRRGVLARVVGSGFAGAAGLPGPFGGLTADAAGYLPVPFPLESTLAVRVGARRAWGDFPVQEAAFLGGSGSLRGSQHQRWAGDAAAFGGAELRTFLTRFNFISRGDLGVIALADAGRVFVDGESPGGWHTSVGGGVWLGILDRTRTLSIVAARGEETAVYVVLGMPF